MFQFPKLSKVLGLEVATLLKKDPDGDFFLEFQTFIEHKYLITTLQTPEDGNCVMKYFKGNTVL